MEKVVVCMPPFLFVSVEFRGVFYTFEFLISDL